MPKRNRICFSTYLLLVILVLAGCSDGTDGITGMGKTNQPSETRLAGTATPIPTSTATATSTITPTATKVPDLEIFNSRWSESGPQGLYFLGNIRNNSDTAMMLPSREYAFSFNIDYYDNLGDEYRHFWWGPVGLKPGVEIQSSNCILYPHETGVIFFSFLNLEDLPGYSLHQETLTKYNGPLGYFYNYSSSYKPSPDLPSKYHPKAQNVKYNISEGNIFFEYDINVPAPKDYATEKGFVMGFLSMYDQDGNIINILYKDIIDFLPRNNPFDNTVHMQGQSPKGDFPVHWNWYLPIKDEDLHKVDHIDLLFEIQYEGICFDKRYLK